MPMNVGECEGCHNEDHAFERTLTLLFKLVASIVLSIIGSITVCNVVSGREETIRLATFAAAGYVQEAVEVSHMKGSKEESSGSVVVWVRKPYAVYYPTIPTPAGWTWDQAN